MFFSYNCKNTIYKNNNEKDKRYDIIYILFRIVISFSDKWR